MIKKILDEILPYKPIRFLKSPRGAYAVYFEDKNYRGADFLISIIEHSLRIEVYSEIIDYEKEAMIEKNIIDLKLPFDKGERLWLNSEQLYMTVYYVEYTTKTGGLKE